MNIIEIEHLKKYYGEVKAVDDISFAVGRGEFFAFLGVNGAGKSTTISILCGRQPCDGGSVKIGGMPLDGHADEIKRKLGVVFQSSVLDAPLSVVCKFIKSQGGITAVETIVSAAYGFLCGAYMPIASLASGIGDALSLLPGTYGTALMHEHFMGGAIDEICADLAGGEIYARKTREGFDCVISFFGNEVPAWACYLIITVTVILLVGLYVLLLARPWSRKRQNKKEKV